MARDQVAQEQNIRQLVCLNVLVSSGAAGAVSAPATEPHVDEQQRVRAIIWSLVGVDDASNQAQVKWTRTIECQAQDDETNRKQLQEALQEIGKSLSGANQGLVTCGPWSLRQQLHPIARRLKLQLAPEFDRYFDLVREFERTKWAKSARVARAQQQQSPCLECLDAVQLTARQLGGQIRWAFEDAPAASDFYSFASNAPPTHRARATCTPTFGARTNAPLLEQHVASARKRLDEMLEALTGAGQQPEFSLATIRKCLKCDAASKRVVGERDADKPAAQQVAAAGDQAKENGADQAASDGNAIWQPAEPTPTSGHCFQCLLLHNEQLVDAMSIIVCRLSNEGHQFAHPELIKRRVEVGLCDVPAHEAEQRLVRARGLPWQATEQDIADFFAGLNISKGGVGLCLSRQGRRNGEALIQFESREHRNLALARHKHFMGQRYIEIYRASAEDFAQLATVQNNNKAEAFLSRGAQVIVRMRGLPFSCAARQVTDFFAATITSDSSKRKQQQQPHAGRTRILKPCQVFGGEEGVLFVKNHDDKPTGDAFVLFANEDEAQRALAKHYENIGARYVELFRSSISEVQQVLSLSAASESQASIKIGSKSPVNGEPREAPATPQSKSQQDSKSNSTDIEHQQDVKELAASAKPNSQHATYAQVANNTCKLDSALANGQQRAEIATEPQTALEDNGKNPEVELPSEGSGAPTPVDCGEQQIEQMQAESLDEPDSPGEVSSLDSSLPKDTTTTCSSSSAASSVSLNSNARPQSYTKRHHHHHHHNHHRTPAHYCNQQHYQRSHNYNPSYQQQSSTNEQAAVAAAAYAAQAYQQQVAYAAMLQQQPLAAHQYQAGYPAMHCYAPPAGFGAPTSVPAGLETSARDCVRLRGLPYEAQTEHVVAFLAKHRENILLQGVHMVYSAQGQPTGEAIIQMDSAAAATAVAQEAHERVMQVGKKQRYIEVIPCSLDDLRPVLGHGVFAAFAASARPVTGYAFPPPQYTHALVAPVAAADSGSVASLGSSSPEVTSGGEQSSSSSASSSTEASETPAERANRDAESAQAAAAYYYHPAQYMYYYPPPPPLPPQHSLASVAKMHQRPIDSHLHQQSVDGQLHQPHN